MNLKNLNRKSLNWKSMILAVAVAAAAVGCGTPNPNGASRFSSINSNLIARVDLGDGEFLDMVPYSVVSKGVEGYNPAVARGMDKIQGQLSKKRRMEKGPFPGMDYVEKRFVLLTDGTVITDERITYIGSTFIPIAPQPFSVLLEPANFKTRPVVGVDGKVVVIPTPPSVVPTNETNVIVVDVPTNGVPDVEDVVSEDDNGGFDPEFLESESK